MKAAFCIALCFQSEGREAEKFLQYLCSNNIVPNENVVGTVVHTGMQNEYGGFENDCTIVRLSENKCVIHYAYRYI